MQDVVYQIVSTRTINTQHGQSTILSRKKADGSCSSAWACGMLMKELLQNPMAMVTSRLFVRPTGSKTSKIGRVQFMSTAAVLINCKLLILILTRSFVDCINVCIFRLYFVNYCYLNIYTWLAKLLNFFTVINLQKIYNLKISLYYL